MMRLFLEHTVPVLLNASGPGDHIQVRLTNVMPSCLLALIDEDRPDGVIYVTILSANQARDVRPSMCVRRREAALYQFFRSEFEHIWNDAKSVADVAPLTAPAP
jgi:hypothetical protein